MGQNNVSPPNPLYQNWQPHPHQQYIWHNTKTEEQVYQHHITLKKSQQILLKRRMQQPHKFITRILYYQPISKNKILQDQTQYFVYTEPLYPVSRQFWIPVTSALSILKGYRRLSSNYGMMRVHVDMIKFNYKKQIQVWINENPVRSDILYRAQSQQQMLSDIVKVVMQFDTQTGGLMANCYTINEAINKILHSITQNKSGIYFTTRPNIRDDRIMITHKKQIIAKNYFRSSKQSQDDSLKPINNSSMKQLIGNYQQIQKQLYKDNNKNNTKLLEINGDKEKEKVGESSEIIQDNNDRKKDIKEGCPQDYQQQANSQKQQKPSSQLQPMKPSASLKDYKPIQQHHLNHSQYNHKLTQPLQKANLTKTNIQKLPNKQSHTHNLYTQKTQNTHIPIKNRSQINTSQQLNFSDNQPFARHHGNVDHFHLMNFGASRTKTQQFYSTNNLNGNSQRLKTNFLSTNLHSPKYPSTKTKVNSIIKQVIPQNFPASYKILKDKPHFQLLSQNNIQKSLQLLPPPSLPKQPHQPQPHLPTAPSQSDALPPQHPPPLNQNQKSMRDLLIKQKVQQKNKKHQDLKIAITKLLNQ